MQVTKNIIPAIASTNALIAGSRIYFLLQLNGIEILLTFLSFLLAVFAFKILILFFLFII